MSTSRLFFPALLGLLLLAAPTAAQDGREDTTSYAFAYEFTSKDPELGQAMLDLLVEAYVKDLSGRVHALVGPRGSVHQDGSAGFSIALEGVTQREIAACSILQRDERDSGMCFVAREGAVDGLDVEAARAALAARLAEHAGHGPDAVDVSDLSWSAGDRTFRWVASSDAMLAERREGALDLDDAPLTVDDYLLLAFDAEGEPPFSPRDLRGAGLTQDFQGNRAVSVWVRKDRAEAFGDFTEAGLHEQMAILIRGRVLSPPATVVDRLEEYFVIQSGSVGGFTRDEVVDVVLELQLAGGLLERHLVSEGEAMPFEFK